MKYQLIAIAFTVAATVIAVRAIAIPASKLAVPVPSVRAGYAISAQCAACHGSNGVSVAANIPNLAGQRYQYLLTQLQAFKAGTRKNPLMDQMAAALSKQQMQDLAAYYASIHIKVGTLPRPKAVKTGG